MIAEAHIHLPLSDNEGKDLHQERLDILHVILNTFGGYTMTEAQGAWQDPANAKVYLEPVLRVTIAADWDEAYLSNLRDIASYASVVMRQECVYISTPQGVEFISPVMAEAVAAE